MNFIKKTWKLFLLFFICVGAGFLTGIIIGMNKNTLSSFCIGIEKSLVGNAYQSLFILGVVLPILNILLGYFGIKKYRLSIEQEKEKDEDGLLNACITISSILQILSLGAFIILCTDTSLITEKQFALSILFEIVSIILNIFTMHMTVEEIKKQDPLKKGDVTNIHFEKIWLNSLDEREQHLAYKASLSAFKAIQITCIALMVFCGMYAETVLNTILPIIICIVIYLVGFLSYTIKCHQLNKTKF